MIESIVNQMTEASKKFYQDRTAEKNIQKCIQHRDALEDLFKKANRIPDVTSNPRVIEIVGILTEAVVYLNKKITQLARYH